TDRHSIASSQHFGDKLLPLFDGGTSEVAHTQKHSALCAYVDSGGGGSSHHMAQRRGCSNMALNELCEVARQRRRDPGHAPVLADFVDHGIESGVWIFLQQVRIEEKLAVAFIANL